MLTLPSEPLPQTVLMEPLPSIPPSFVSYGLSGSRRSPRKHHVTERRPALKPYDKTSAHSRARHSTDTALASHSVPSRLERTPPKPQTQERLDISVSTENICDTLTRPKISSQKPCVSPLSDSSLLDADAKPKPSSLAPDTAPKGWVIGPLFQSFKSKMASFTEIVMSPFKSSEAASVESTGDGYVTAEEDGNQQSEHKKSPPKHGVEDEEGTGLTCKITDNSEARLQSNVPSQTLKTELESSAIQSAWNPNTTAFTTTSTAPAAAASFCKALDMAEEASVSLGVRARKRPNKSTLKEAELCDIKEEAQHAGKDMDCNFLTSTDSDFEKLSGFNPQGDAGESQADQTPTSPSILEEASLKKVKRTLDLSCDAGKRKKTEEGAEREESDKKRKPKLNKGHPDAGKTLKTIAKAVTRSNHKKCKVDQREDIALKICNGQDSRTSEDPKCAKAKVKTTKRTKTKGDQSLDLQTSTSDTLTTAMDLKPNGKMTVTSKKRKAKDDLSVKSDVNALTSMSAAVDTVSTEPLKKIKTKDGTVEVEVKLSRGVTEKVSFEMALPESDAPQVSEPDEGANERGVTKRRSRRMDLPRRRSRALHATKSPTKRRAEDTCLSQDDSEAFRKGSATRLLRSVSCPEIPTLRLHEAPWTPHFHSPPRSRSQPPQQQQQQHHALPHSLSSSSSLAQHFHRSARRTRRHTVCSLEVEREIAPLCLRKEVYPARRSPSPYDPQHISPMRVLSPGTSLSALASCFLSSPLAFLSKKSEGGTRSSVSSPTRALSPTVRLVSPTVRLVSPSPSSSSSGPSLTSLLGTSLGQLPGFHLRTDTLLNASSDATNSAVGLLDCAPDQPPAPDEDEDTSSSSPESEELREETTHSDSELKVLKKDQGHRKVSSIKIRKALPKPQNNLTPMGLPKAVRVKKKEFSLEEIYTNKNFSKPPESRLETIFEVPLSRKNGSESWCGPRRLKRFLEFPELGEARRPRKLLTGATKATATKTNNSSSRPRRGGGREDPALGSDPDSMLCAKLEQLGLWMQQNHG